MFFIFKRNQTVFAILTCIRHKVYDKNHMKIFFDFYLVISPCTQSQSFSLTKRSECYLNAMHQTQTSIQIWNGTLHTRTYTHWRSHLLFPCSQGWKLYNVCISVMCWLFNVTPSTLWSVRIVPNVVLYTIPYERYIPMWPCNLSIHTHVTSIVIIHVISLSIPSQNHRSHILVCHFFHR